MKKIDFDAAMKAGGAVKNEHGQWIQDGKVVGMDMTMMPSNEATKEIIKDMFLGMGLEIPDELK